MAARHKEGGETLEDHSLPKELLDPDLLLSDESDLSEGQIRLQQAILMNLMARQRTSRMSNLAVESYLAQSTDLDECYDNRFSTR